MSSLNQVSLIGNLGADPEIKSFQNGGKIANLRLACSESWKDKQTGEKKERTEWVSVSVQNDGLVGVVERFLKKGGKVFVQGALRTRKWQDQSGGDRYTTEVVVSGFGGKIVLLGDTGQRGGQSNSAGNDSGWTGMAPAGGGGGGVKNYADDLDDDIPFATSESVW